MRTEEQARSYERDRFVEEFSEMIADTLFDTVYLVVDSLGECFSVHKTRQGAEEWLDEHHDQYHIEAWEIQH